MSNRFYVPEDSPPPSTPDRFSSNGGGRGGGRYGEDNPPSTTPAGAPPHTADKSFTPAGAPSASYLGSSIMRAVAGQTPSSSNRGGGGGGGGRQKAAGGAAALSSRNIFAAAGNKGGSSNNNRGSGNSPLGRSIRGSQTHRPSGLSKQYVVEDDEEDEEDEAQEEDQQEEDDDEDEGAAAPRGRPGSFAARYRSGHARDMEEEDDDAEYEDDDDGGYQHGDEAMHDAGDEESETGDGGRDMWLDMRQGSTIAPRPDFLPDDSDLLMFATPAANDRIRREAEDLFRATASRSASRREQEFKFASLAKDLYIQLGYASITETGEIILKTEEVVSALYQDGIGAADDQGRLDNSLATAAGGLARLWGVYASKLPKSDEEHAAEIGPGPRASSFEKAYYLAILALRLHHTRLMDQEPIQAQPMPQILFEWLAEYHNLYTSQMDEVLSYKPSPAVHTMFWQTVFMAVLRGNVADAQGLLANAGWEHVRDGRGGRRTYEGQALLNVDKAAHSTCEMLENCPAMSGNWDVWHGDWTVFRIHAAGALDQLRRFAEGRDHRSAATAADDSEELSDSLHGRQSMTGMARKAESHVPWEVYENLQIVFDIVLGSQNAIVASAQDWCEATVGLFGWWDAGKAAGGGDGRTSVAALSRSQSLMLASQEATTDSYLDRLAWAFHTATEHDFHFNSLNPVEVGMACVFEGNAKGVIGILRSWSLPIAAAVAEIASLGGWLPPHQPSPLLGMGDLDMDDLEVLGVDSGSPDEADGIRDATLILYAQELANVGELSYVKGSGRLSLQGWEVAVQILGRMDSPERSEETVGELLRAVLADIDADAGETVDKVWRLLNELGMIEFAEDTAESFGDILARDSHRYGDAMRYYALAHRPNKAREVMNLLIAYSLIQSMAYPPAELLDDSLRRLLEERNATLELFAKQDLEAAELVGKMLSGYATLRKFYNIRDSGAKDSKRGSSNAASHLTPARRQQAAAALTSVIAAADDSIRGGLFDPSRDAVVSEDFLLALLGEALIFVSGGAGNTSTSGGRRNTTAGRDAGRLGASAAAPALSLSQIDTLLKALEDLHCIGPRIANAAEEFLQVVLASAPGVKGASPADMLRKSRGNSGSGDQAGSGGGFGSASGSASSSYVLSGSSMLASKLHRSISAGWTTTAEEGRDKMSLGGDVKRGWDWRAGVGVSTTGEEIVRRLRLGLTRDLARLWLEEADEALPA